MTKKTTSQSADFGEELAKLLEGIGSKQKSGQLPTLTKGQREKLQELLSAHEVDKVDRAAFKKRGYKYATVEESWDALRSIAEATKLGKYPPVDAMHWLSAAYERTKGNDEIQLVRELGLLVRGRKLTVNPESVAELVQKFIDSGSGVMDACALASQQMGCTMKTAHRWYKATLGAATDGRRR